MKNSTRIFLYIFTIFVFLISVSCALIPDKMKDQTLSCQSESHQCEDKRYRNPEAIEGLNWSRTFAMFKRYMNEEVVNQTPDFDVPVLSLNKKQINSLPVDSISVVRLGHSSLLLRIAGQLWLIDPVFSERVSPFKSIGPKRFHAPPLAIDQLPSLTGVVISHNHYDHLDRASIEMLKGKVEHFIVPLGLAAFLEDWGVDKSRIQELDWWQSTKIDTLEITSTPAQHFSGRGLFDRNLTLWSSFVLKAPQGKVFYSGDGGYFKGFREIGKTHGPFDLTIMEVGAYDKMWSQVHMFPAEALQAHKDLRGKLMLPVHNGTFDLAFHPWSEPFEQLTQLAPASGVDMVTPRMGEIFSISQNFTSVAWWRKATNQ